MRDPDEILFDAVIFLLVLALATRVVVFGGESVDENGEVWLRYLLNPLAESIKQMALYLSGAD